MVNSEQPKSKVYKITQNSIQKMRNSEQPKSKAYKITQNSIQKMRNSWKNPNALPIPYDRGTMESAVSNFETMDVKKVYNHLKNAGGKKSKRITIKKKKARKTLKKPMFKRKSAKHK
tara:strand:+ start:511 stop:861 length:351 start_codon:yes stop_codon:yes gene_type:complete